MKKNFKKTLLPLVLVSATILTLSPSSRADQTFKGQSTAWRFDGTSYPCEIQISRSFFKTVYDFGGLVVSLYDGGTVRVQEPVNGESFKAQGQKKVTSTGFEITAKATKSASFFIANDHGMEVILDMDASGNLQGLYYSSDVYEIANFKGIEYRGGIRANCFKK